MGRGAERAGSGDPIQLIAVLQLYIYSILIYYIYSSSLTLLHSYRLFKSRSRTAGLFLALPLTLSALPWLYQVTPGAGGKRCFS